ncbi:hypothetical protein ACRWP7_003297 [Escherichia coli]
MTNTTTSFSDNVTTAPEYFTGLMVIFLGLVIGVIVLIFLVGVVRKNKHLKEASGRYLGMFSKMVGCSALLSLGVILIYSYSQKDNEWKEFSNEHCQVIEKKDGQSASGVGLTLRGHIGAFFGGTSPQTVYKCDDGITYTKNN